MTSSPSLHSGSEWTRLKHEKVTPSIPWSGVAAGVAPPNGSAATEPPGESLFSRKPGAFVARKVPRQAVDKRFSRGGNLEYPDQINNERSTGAPNKGPSDTGKVAGAVKTTTVVESIPPAAPSKPIARISDNIYSVDDLQLIFADMKASQHIELTSRKGQYSVISVGENKPNHHQQHHNNQNHSHNHHPHHHAVGNRVDANGQVLKDPSKDQNPLLNVPISRWTQDLGGLEITNHEFRRKPKLQNPAAAPLPMTAMSATSAISAGISNRVPVTTRPGFGSWSPFSAMGASLSPYSSHTNLNMGPHTNVAPPQLPTGPLISQIPPGLAPVHVTVPLESVRWTYQDTNGDEQGPFTPHQMHEWYLGQWLGPDLKMKTNHEPAFYSLGEYIQRVKNTLEPFLVPAIISRPLEIPQDTRALPTRNWPVHKSSRSDLRISQPFTESLTIPQPSVLPDTDSHTLTPAPANLQPDPHLEVTEHWASPSVASWDQTKPTRHDLQRSEDHKPSDLSTETNGQMDNVKSEKTSAQQDQSDPASETGSSADQYERPASIAPKSNSRKTAQRRDHSESSRKSSKKLAPLPAPSTKSSINNAAGSTTLSTQPIVTPATEPAKLAPWAAVVSQARDAPSLVEIQLDEAAEHEKIKEQEHSGVWKSTGETARKSQNLPLYWGTLPSASPSKSLAEIQREEMNLAQQESAATETKSRHYADAADPTSGSKTLTTSRSSTLPRSSKAAAVDSVEGGAWATVGPGGRKLTSKASTPSIRSSEATAAKLTMGKKSATKVLAAKSNGVGGPSASGNLTNSTTSSATSEFLTWCKSALSQLNHGVNQVELLSILMSLPLSADSKEIIADTIYSNSSTMDGRRFADEFLKRRASASAPSGETWSEVIQRVPAVTKSESDGWNTTFKVVRKKKLRN